jgi:hypothetical protein
MVPEIQLDRWHSVCGMTILPHLSTFIGVAPDGVGFILALLSYRCLPHVLISKPLYIIAEYF